MVVRLQELVWHFFDPGLDFAAESSQAVFNDLHATEGLMCPKKKESYRAHYQLYWV